MTFRHYLSHWLPTRRPHAKSKSRKRKPARRLRLEALEDRCVPAVFTVTNTDDLGPGSLRQVILDANANLGADRIEFNIPGTGVQTISPTSALPGITDAVIIDGGNGGDSTNRVQISGGGALSTGLSVPESAGGPTVEIRNLVINGFTTQEISVIFGSGDVIQGNFLGLDPDGNLVPNSGDGIDIVAATGATIGGATAAERNVIAGFGGGGITIDRSSATIQGNFIGLDATGTEHLGSFGQGISVFNAGVTIGGTSAGEGNVIVARTGILFSGNPPQGHSSGTVQGNFIGTDVTGTVDLNLGNGPGIELDLARGVLINGGNVISGNGDGIDISSSGTTGATSDTNTVQGNFIGTAADGVTALGNSGDGILIGSSFNNLVGGADSGQGNVIAFNGHVGVHIVGDGSTGNAVEGNSIFANGLLGIDLAGGDEDRLTGMTRNDAGDGDGNSTGTSNNLQNFPVLTLVHAAGDTTITGTLNSTPNTAFRIEFFASNAADPSGFGEGQTFLGFIGPSNETTTDGNGDLSFTASLAQGVSAAQVITATATDPAGNTSEFSAIHAVQATASADLAVSQTDFPDPVTAGVNFTYRITVTNNGPDTATGVTLTDTLPAGVTLQFTNHVFSQSGNKLTFLLSDLASGASTQVVVVVRQTMAGTISNVATISANEPDPNTANNSDTETTLVNPAAATHFSVSAPSTTLPGVAFTVSVTALDQFQNTAAGYRGTVHFSSSDIGANVVLPPDVTFSNSDAGKHTFTNGVTLQTTGTQTITATDGGNSTINGSTAVLVAPSGATIFVVTNTLDSGPGSLRQAILNANLHPGNDTISFQIGSGTHTIFVGDSGLGALPYIGDAVIIDGTTQPGFLAKPLIELDGANVGAGVFSGLTITAGNSTVKGLVINDFSGSGVSLKGGNNLIAGNYLGTDLSGLLAKGNGIAGVEIISGSNDTIGGTTAGARNVISGNVGGRGVLLDPLARTTTVAGNFVGTDFAGTHALPNNTGIEVNSSFLQSFVAVIGGTTLAARNVISGNNGEGVLLLRPANILGNFIGTDVSGTHALGNGVGVDVLATGVKIGGTSPGARNVISGNVNVGVEIDADSAVVQGNFIGSDVLGTHAVGNLGSGISITGGSSNLIGGEVPAARNVISGNLSDGIQFFSLSGDATKSNRVQGNFIGPDVTGRHTLGNQQNGVALFGGEENTIGGTTFGARNVISGNQASGVLIQGATAKNNLVQGNFIGLIATGTVKLANANGVEIDQAAVGNTIGGSVAGARNILSGNSNDGVLIHNGATNNLVEGNFIGVNSTGTLPLPNGSPTQGSGVEIDAPQNTIGGTTLGTANVISGNRVGVLIDTRGAGNVVEGNFVGTNPTGTKGFANITGIRIEGFGNTLGGTVPGAGNVISGNNLAGVELRETAAENLVQGNYLGVDVTGKVALGNAFGVDIVGAQNNTIGGTAAAARNIISGNRVHGVLAKAAAAGNRVLGNYIGTDVTGGVALGNGFVVGGGTGVQIDGANANIVGGTTPGAANVISGNAADGVRINSASGNQVLGNLIGTDVSGTKAVRNGANGVDLVNSTGNIVGGGDPGSRNVISGNQIDGVLISGGSGNQVLGNFIGTDTFGVTRLANGVPPGLGVPAAGSGVEITAGGQSNQIGGSNPVERNIISGNAISQVRIFGAGTAFNLVEGNFIGTDVSGTVALLGSVFSPIGIVVADSAQNNLIGGITPGAGNLISGNSGNGLGHGVLIKDSATGNAVQGNLIGTDVSGTHILPNDFGVSINSADGNTIGGSTQGAGNVISGNSTGVNVQSLHNMIQGNLIGTDVSGTQALANATFGIHLRSVAHSNSIGGTTVGARNVISGNGGAGIQVDASGNQVQGNFIGTDISGAFAVANAGGGVIVKTGGTVIGGSTPGAANVISGNALDGILMSGTAVSANQVQGNLIGTDVTGNFALPNAGNGVQIAAGAHDNTIGGASSEAGNVISGNALDGVLITGTGTKNNQVLGNFIGTDPSGTFGVANERNGVEEAFGAATNTVGAVAAGNVISGNSHNGVLITGPGTTGNQVLGNFIGTDPSGTFVVRSFFDDHQPLDGVAITTGASANTVGGAAAGAGNVISGNRDGVLMDNANSNLVLGNLIGTDVTGTFAIPNRECGVDIENVSRSNIIGGAAGGAGNVVSGNTGAGTRIGGHDTTGNQVLGNLIGVDISGTFSIANGSGVTIDSFANGNIVGGSSTGAGNVISGNTLDGLSINGVSGTVVQGNLIGTDITGSVAVPNGQSGVSVNRGSATIGGTAQGARNVISGNAGDGVIITHRDQASLVFNNVLTGNFIGTDVSGTLPLGNGGNGVANQVTGTIIGGSAAGASNVIAFNGLAGVLVDAGVSNSISRNSIFANAGLGIDLNPANNANNNQSAPQLTSAHSNGTSVTINGKLTSTAGKTFTFEFFVSDAGDPEGKTFLGAKSFTTNSLGKISFIVMFSVQLPPGSLITATATDPNGNTSEFSDARVVS